MRDAPNTPLKKSFLFSAASCHMTQCSAVQSSAAAVWRQPVKYSFSPTLCYFFFFLVTGCCRRRRCQDGQASLKINVANLHLQSCSAAGCNLAKSGASAPEQEWEKLAWRDPACGGGAACGRMATWTPAVVLKCDASDVPAFRWSCRAALQWASVHQGKGTRSCFVFQSQLRPTPASTWTCVTASRIPAATVRRLLQTKQGHRCMLLVCSQKPQWSHFQTHRGSRRLLYMYIYLLILFLFFFFICPIFLV